MIIRFLSSSDKTMIWSRRSELKGMDIWLKHDFPASVEKAFSYSERGTAPRKKGYSG